MTPEEIAQCATLAMALEVSATPKPGNIDREHNYPDTRYEHFLASAIATYPLIAEAAKQTKGFGKLLHDAIVESNNWQQGGNTHFGALTLLIPLAMAEGSTTKAHEIVKKTTTEDAIHFYQAFKKADVNVPKVDKLSLHDQSATREIYQEKKTLYQLMQIAETYDEIAREWTQKFPLTQQAHQLLTEHTRNQDADINEAIVQTYLEILKTEPDTFIQTKHNKATAIQTSQKAAKIINQIKQQGYISTLPEIKKFDTQLLSRKINPGSTADIIIAGLFLLLLGGYRY